MRRNRVKVQVWSSGRSDKKILRETTKREEEGTETACREMDYLGWGRRLGGGCCGEKHQTRSSCEIPVNDTDSECAMIPRFTLGTVTVILATTALNSTVVATC